MMKSILALHMAVVCGMVSHAAAPTADELLARHAVTLEACLRSFAAKAESTVQYDDTKTIGQRAVPQKRETFHRTTEVRFDGRHLRQILHTWGDVGRMQVPKEQFVINSLIHDADFRASYTGRISRIGSVQYFREPLDIELAQERAYTWMPASRLFGFLPSGKNLDVVLRGSAVLRPQTEQVNGSECYVIDGAAEEERYTIWIDPQHGHHMAKIRTTSDRSENLRTVLAFKQMGDAWIPAETLSEGWMQFNDAESTLVRSRVQQRITEFLIAPDHEALRSFALDDFPNGAEVGYHENGQFVPGRFVWQDGRPVADVPQSAIDELDKTAKSLE